MRIRLIVGLANPGKELSFTRHNAGAWFVEACAARHGILMLPHPALSALVGIGTINDLNFPCAITSTPINTCGATVASLSELYDIPREEILIVHDDLRLLPGLARFKFNRNNVHCLHNGIRDITQHLRTNQFNRLALGIGHPGITAQVGNYVMSNPDDHEREKIDTAIQYCLDWLPEILSGDWHKVMAVVHTRSTKPKFKP